MKVFIGYFAILTCLLAQQHLVTLKDHSTIFGVTRKYPEFLVVSTNGNNIVIPQYYIKSVKEYEEASIGSKTKKSIDEIVSRSFSISRKNFEEEEFRYLVYKVKEAVNKDTEEYEKSIGKTNEVMYNVSFYREICEVAISQKTAYFVGILHEVKKHPDISIYNKCLALFRTSSKYSHIFYLLSLVQQKQNIISVYNILKSIHKKNRVVGSVLVQYFKQVTNITEEDSGLLALLGQIKYDSGFYTLRRFAKSQNRILALAAIESLGELATTNSISVLQNLLNSENLIYKRKAIYALGKTQETAVIPDLVPLLENPSTLVVQSVHWSLCNITGEKYPPKKSIWESWWRKEQENQVIVSRLMSNLYGDPQQIITTLRDLAKYKSRRTISKVEDLMFNESPQIRREACLYLEKLGYPLFPDVLIDLFDQEPDSMNQNLIHTILKRQSKCHLEKDPYLWRKWWEAQPIHYNGSEEGLLELLKVHEESLLAVAIEELGDIKSQKAAEPLRNLLKKHYTKIELQKKIIKALRKIRDYQSIPLLIDLLNDESLKTLSYSALLTITKERFANKHSVWLKWYNKK